MRDWRSKLILNDGEALKKTGSATKGFMGETDVDLYDIVNTNGGVTGSVKVEDHTAVKGFRRTLTVTQRNSSGETVVHDSWEPKD